MCVRAKREEEGAEAAVQSGAGARGSCERWEERARVEDLFLGHGQRVQTRSRAVSGLTGRTVVSRFPTSTTRPVTVPAAISASNGAEAKLSDGTCARRVQ